MTVDVAGLTGFRVTARPLGRDRLRAMTADAGRSPGDLMRAVASGDEAAFAQLYDDVSPRVFGLIRRIVVDPAIAEEVCQETFLDVWRQAGRFDPGRGSALSWIFVIAHRRSVDRVRAVSAARQREQAYGAGHLEREFDTTADQVGQRLDASQVRGALTAMSDVQREAVELAYFGGLSHAQVAERLGIALGTAKSRIRDGLLSMRRQLGGEAP